MLRRSTLVAAALAASASYVQAEGSIDNNAAAKQINSQAVSFNGDYTITAANSGHKLVYGHTSQPNFWPTSDPIEELIQWIEDEFDNGTADDVFQLIANKDDNSVMIANEKSMKAAASQWNPDTNQDGYAVAYGYGDGGTGTTGDKEWWYFVPCPLKGSSSSTSSSSSSSSTSKSKTGSSSSSSSSSSSGCPKSPEWVYRNGNSAYLKKHPECKGTGQAPKCEKDGQFLNEHKSYVKSHPECKSSMEEYAKSNKRMSKRGHRQILEERKEKKRSSKKAKKSSKSKSSSSSSDTYCIVAKDHITDMKTMVMTSQEATAYAEAKAALMAYYDPSDETQIWQVDPASSSS